MNKLTTIPAAQLADLNLKQGDSLVVISSHDDEIVVEVRRESPEALPQGSHASKWLHHARGIVRLESGETANGIRNEFYSQKHGLDL